uniref:AP2/ERF domain-containing protein n=1 Tax=Euplotes harpa TaxID=151035 RepID=A0A7S3J2Z1_9SPIT|mmetsp:Transcript_11885/g.13512  ORF Transcript_11885/g.13512 Transcript_11885/m.13512 type:complete len:244 (+) Transcript_11885:67-798(+)
MDSNFPSQARFSEELFSALMFSGFQSHQLVTSMVKTLELLNVMDAFCLCPQSDGCHSELNPTQVGVRPEPKTDTQVGAKTDNQTHSQPGLAEFDRVCQLKPLNQRKRRKTLPELDGSLATMADFLARNPDFVLSPRDKGTRGLHNGLSNRRSRFIGVSLNGSHWQTLINFKKSKKYIGAYCSEVEAALAYDFYSIALYSFDAKTNFEYGAGLLAEMIAAYFESGRKFEPAAFAARVGVQLQQH